MYVNVYMHMCVYILTCAHTQLCMCVQGPCKWRIQRSCYTGVLVKIATVISWAQSCDVHFDLWFSKLQLCIALYNYVCGVIELLSS